MRLLRIAAVLAASSLVSQAQFVHTRGTEIIGRDGQPLHIKGTNLGNWMVPEGYFWRLKGPIQSPGELNRFFTRLVGPTRDAAFWIKFRATWITQADIRFLHDAGFNTIRIPLNAGLLQTDDSQGFRMLDQVIGWAREAGIYVVLDMHAAPGGQTGSNIDDSDGYPWVYEDASLREQYLTLWQRIAQRYHDERTILGYDLLNEPLPHYPRLAPLQSQLEPLYKEVTARIRRVDKHHAIILEGSQWDNDFSVFGKPFDANTIYEIHHYGNFDDKYFEPYEAFRTKYNVPLYLGESGENTDEWITKVRSLMDAHNVGWTFWPYKKMHNTASLVTCAFQASWDPIVAFSETDQALSDHKDNFSHRPEQAVIDKALADVLANVSFEKCKVNEGYLRALLPNSPSLSK